MKETILSNCERNFILRAALEQKRLDGRKLDEFRKLRVSFGSEWGSCYVSLGETKVLAQVNCEVLAPKTTRPNEGLLFVNVELNTMAASHFESNRGSDLSVHLNRLLEKCIKDSNAVDLESLCIVAEDKAWALRVVVNVLNHEGSLIDCASVAALAALAHFRRPDVTTDGQEIKIHDASERDPIPTTLHHYPVCVSFALMNNGESVIADPTAIEERVSDASLVFGVNAYRELCGLHLGGGALAKPKLILKYSSKAASRAKEIVQLVKSSLQKDEEARQSGEIIGFVEQFEFNQPTSMSEDRLKIQLHSFTLSATADEGSPQTNAELEGGDGKIVNLGNNCAELLPSSKSSEGNHKSDTPPPSKIPKMEVDIQNHTNTENYGEGCASQWEVDVQTKTTIDDSTSSEEDEIKVLPVVPKQIENIELSGDSEEEEILVLKGDEISSARERIEPKKVSSSKSVIPNLSTTVQKENSKVRIPKKNRKRRKK